MTKTKSRRTVTAVTLDKVRVSARSVTVLAGQAYWYFFFDRLETVPQVIGWPDRVQMMPMYVACERHRAVYCHGTAVYMYILISLWLLRVAALVGRVQWRMKKNDRQPAIYACRTTMCHLLI